MEKQPPVEFNLDVFADHRTVRDVVRGVLHAIFFHRFFPTITPSTRDVLDVTIPTVHGDAELETLIEQRAAELEALASARGGAGGGGGLGGGTSGGSGRAQVVVQFFERVRRKTWLPRGNDEVCWEAWTVRVTVAEPKTESERAKVRRAAQDTLQRTVIDIVTKVGNAKDHIPPITAMGGNPFPYKIMVAAADHHHQQKQVQQQQAQEQPPAAVVGWAARMGMGLGYRG